MAVLTVESTSFCNLDCGMCGGRLSKRSYSHMDWELFKKIIKDASQNSHYIKYIHLYGEPLLWPHLLDGVKYLFQSGAAHQDFEFATNATLLSKKTSHYLVNVGIPLFFIGISSLRQNIYKILRKGGNLDIAIRNTLDLINIAEGKARVEIQLLITSINEDETIDEFKHVFSESEYVKIKPINAIRHATDIDGDRTMTVTNVHNNSCPKLGKYLIVQSSGHCVMCNWDWTDEQRVGDLSVQSIDQVIESEIYNRTYNKIRKAEVSDLPRCKVCLT